jgi:hypothetical protein
VSLKYWTICQRTDGRPLCRRIVSAITGSRHRPLRASRPSTSDIMSRSSSTVSCPQPSPSMARSASNRLRSAGMRKPSRRRRNNPARSRRADHRARGAETPPSLPPLPAPHHLDVQAHLAQLWMSGDPVDFTPLFPLRDAPHRTVDKMPQEKIGKSVLVATDDLGFALLPAASSQTQVTKPGLPKLFPMP